MVGAVPAEGHAAVPGMPGHRQVPGRAHDLPPLPRLGLLTGKGEGPMARGDALLSVTRPRYTLGASAAVWTAAEILHAAHAGPLDPALASMAFTGLAYGVTSRRGRRHAVQVTWVTGLAGGWLTLASQAGPLGSGHILTWVWGGATAAGMIALNFHSAVRKARDWRDARSHWLHTAPGLGLHDSHLLEHERTRLGERLRVDVSATGKLASSLAGSSLAETIAQQRKLPRSRVRVHEAGIAGQIEVSIRTKDPWKHPITHPLLDPDPEISLPVPATVREPLIVGQDPETGRPLKLTLWDQHGSRNIYIIGKKGAGKTALLNDLRERVTACDDAQLYDINLSKAQEDLEWAPACHLTAIGRDERKRALLILKLVSKVIAERGIIPRDDKVVKPSPSQPAPVVMIDEIDALTDGGDWIAAACKHELGYITSKGRSEGVVFIAAGQRGTAEWMGGSNVRTQLDTVCVGKVRRQGEVNHAVGSAGAMIPDMASYGEGHPGVWAFVEDGGDYELGRTFNLSELPDLRQIAHDRRRREPDLEPLLAERLGDLYAGLRSSQLDAYHQDDAPETRPPGDLLAAVLDAADAPGAVAAGTAYGAPGDALDRELEEALPGELRDLARKMDATNADTRRMLAEADGVEAPDVTPEQMADFVQARWRQVAAATEIPAEAREKLLGLLAGEGTTISRAAVALAVKPWTMRKWLERLRAEGLVCVEGVKRGARWKLATPDDGEEA